MHFVETMNTCCGFLCDADDSVSNVGPALCILCERAGECFQHNRVLLGGVRIGLGNDAGCLEFLALVNEQGCVSTVVKDHVGALTVWPHQDLLRAPPILREGLALPCVHRNTLLD